MKIVYTEHSKQPTDRMICQCCGKTLATIDNDIPTPSFLECYNSGNIPVPNFGWICSQDCAEKFEKEHNIKFARTAEGKIDYYNGKLEV
jgi:hypothetical protein